MGNLWDWIETAGKATGKGALVAGRATGNVFNKALERGTLSQIARATGIAAASLDPDSAAGKGGAFIAGAAEESLADLFRQRVAGVDPSKEMTMQDIMGLAPSGVPQSAIDEVYAGFQSEKQDKRLQAQEDRLNRQETRDVDRLKFEKAQHQQNMEIARIQAQTAKLREDKIKLEMDWEESGGNPTQQIELAQRKKELVFRTHELAMAQATGAVPEISIRNYTTNDPDDLERYKDDLSVRNFSWNRSYFYFLELMRKDPSMPDPIGTEVGRDDLPGVD